MSIKSWTSILAVGAAFFILSAVPNAMASSSHRGTQTPIQLVAGGGEGAGGAAGGSTGFGRGSMEGGTDENPGAFNNGGTMGNDMDRGTEGGGINGEGHERDQGTFGGQNSENYENGGTGNDLDQGTLNANPDVTNPGAGEQEENEGLGK